MPRVLVHAVVEAWRGIVRNRAFGGVVIAILALGAGSAVVLVGLTDVRAAKIDPVVALRAD